MWFLHGNIQCILGNLSDEVTVKTNSKSILMNKWMIYMYVEWFYKKMWYGTLNKSVKFKHFRVYIVFVLFEIMLNFYDKILILNKFMTFL